MFFSFLQLAIRSRDLSQAEKEKSIGKAEQIHKVTYIFTQNDNFLHHDHFELSFCKFAQRCKESTISQLETNHVIQ
jgi:hypothetical protein